MSVSDILVPNNLTIYSKALSLPSGGDQTPINNYEEYTFVTGLTGARSVTTYNIKIVRINNTVTLSAPVVTTGDTTSSDFIRTTTDIPARFRPIQKNFTPIFFKEENFPKLAYLGVVPDGIAEGKVVFTSSASNTDDLGTFPNTTEIFIGASSITYSLL